MCTAFKPGRKSESRSKALQSLRSIQLPRLLSHQTSKVATQPGCPTLVSFCATGLGILTFVGGLSTSRSTSPPCPCKERRDKAGATTCKVKAKAKGWASPRGESSETQRVGHPSGSLLRKSRTFYVRDLIQRPLSAGAGGVSETGSSHHVTRRPRPQSVRLYTSAVLRVRHREVAFDPGAVPRGRLDLRQDRLLQVRPAVGRSFRADKPLRGVLYTIASALPLPACKGRTSDDGAFPLTPLLPTRAVVP